MIDWPNASQTCFRRRRCGATSRRSPVQPPSAPKSKRRRCRRAPKLGVNLKRSVVQHPETAADQRPEKVADQPSETAVDRRPGMAAAATQNSPAPNGRAADSKRRHNDRVASSNQPRNPVSRAPQKCSVARSASERRCIQPSLTRNDVRNIYMKMENSTLDYLHLSKIFPFLRLFQRLARK